MDFFKTIDTHFLGITNAIAVYCIPHPDGLALIETGPGSTLPVLIEKLAAENFVPQHITDVFLTHIHLDHAGAAGALARLGARIHVHPNGAPHLLNPEKLLASASRIYGNEMDRLWGEFLPVPEAKLSVLADGEIVKVGSLTVTAVETPGHANHHYAYLVSDVLFSGDVGGIRMPGTRHLRLPMPPPELNLEQWRASTARIKEINFSRIAPTHFGVFDDPGWHLGALEDLIASVDDWMQHIMPSSPTVDEINQRFTDWTINRSLQEGLSGAQIDRYEAANPTWMSAAGIQRYWNKFRS
jgi:glyoxylase-like metal-dependent hydrolase (beta-lactamase superfamily II)